MSQISLKIFVAMLVIIFTATSCLCPATKPVVKQEKKAKVVVDKQEQEVVVDGCDVCSLIKVSANGPKEAIIGQEYMDEVDVTALQNAGEVQLMTRIPPTLQYVRSEPPADVQGNKLVWDLQSLNKGDVRKVKIWVRSNQEGRQWLCFTAFALPRYCVDTNIGSAKLAIRKDGPATAQLNGTITYTIVVENTGTATASNVVVNDQLPQGLVATGATTFQVGDMPAKSSKTFSVTAKAANRGKFCNVAVATSGNAGQVQAEACTTVVKNDLEPSLVCPREGVVGQRGDVVMGIANTGDTPLTNVRATVEYPMGVQVVSSECTPAGQNVWNVGTIAPGAQANCKAVIMGKTEGKHCIKMVVTSAEGINKEITCCTEYKGVAQIQITKTAPATAQVGETFNYNIEVKNVGTGVARDVVMTDTFPPIVSSPRGRDIRESIGDLAVGQSRTFTYPVKAEQSGTAVNVAKATASNAAPVEAPATTVIQQIAANLVVTCQEVRFVNQPQKTEIVFANVGGVALTNVTITARWSNQLKVRTTEPQATITGQQAVWTIPSLAPGQQKSIVMSMMCMAPGRECIEVMAQNSQITKTAQCCTEWKGQPALLLEVIDTQDPVSVGEETTYVIEVTNQGTALDENIRITVTFPQETQAIKIGPDIPGTIQGKKVVFQAVPVLQPKQKVKYSIVAKGLSVGDTRLVTELESKMLTRPVREEESTQVVY